MEACNRHEKTCDNLIKHTFPGGYLYLGFGIALGSIKWNLDKVMISAFGSLSTS